MIESNHKGERLMKINIFGKKKAKDEKQQDVIKDAYLKNEPLLSADTTIDRLYLRVNDIEKQVAFYTTILNMNVFEQDGTSAILGSTSDPLLYLHEDQTAGRDIQATGLYHFALLYPNEAELAKTIYRLIERGYMNYPTDHAMSKTTYLKDAEGNDIELYVRTLERVKFAQIDTDIVMSNPDGTIADTRAELDLNELFSHIKEPVDLDARMPAGTSLGHVHIYSRNLEEMLIFYRDVIGFGESMISREFRMGEVALANGRNHVIAFNTWKGADAPLVAEGALGLDYYVLRVNQVDYDRMIERLKNAGISFSTNENSIIVHDPANVEIRIEVNK